MQKIIFLDIDGVLVHHNYTNRNRHDIDPEKVSLLKQICDTCQASVVITSSWRGTLNHTPRCYYALLNILQESGIDILGTVPYINEDSLSVEAKKHRQIGRGAEVREWLLNHPETESFVILDDENFDWESYKLDSYWIRTDFENNGLLPNHVEKSIRILNKKHN